MAARWDGNSGKLYPFSSKRQSKRISPKVSNSDDNFSEVCSTGGQYDPDTKTGTPIGTPRLLTPEQRYNYKSAWARYEKGLLLRPSKVEAQGKNTIYYYHTCHSLSGYWEVTVSPGLATFIDAGVALNILCPPADGYQLTQVKSDGETYVWEQISGNRTVILDPPTDLNPKIFIANSCFTAGCDNGSSLPIILKVFPEGQPDLFDYLTVYNTPTSQFYFGSSVASIGQTEIACRIPLVIFAPLYLQKAYTTVEGTITFTWNPPTCDSEFLTRYIWQVNTTGQYVDVDEFLPSEEPFFEVNTSQHYRLITEFNIHGKITRTYSDIIYFPGNNQKLIFADDNLGLGAVSGISGSYFKSDLKVTSYQYDDSYSFGSSVSAISGGYTKTDLKVSSYQYEDSYASGFSVSGIGGSYVKTNLGGIVIG